MWLLRLPARTSTPTLRRMPSVGNTEGESEQRGDGRAVGGYVKAVLRVLRYVGLFVLFFLLLDVFFTLLVDAAVFLWVGELSRSAYQAVIGIRILVTVILAAYWTSRMRPRRPMPVARLQPQGHGARTADESVSAAPETTEARAAVETPLEAPSPTVAVEGEAEAPAPIIATGLVSEGQVATARQPESARVGGHTRRRMQVVLAVALVAAGSIGTLGAMWLIQEWPWRRDASLQDYVMRVAEATKPQASWVTWEWVDGGEHRGSLFGPGVAMDHPNNPERRRCPANPVRLDELVSQFEGLSVELASISPPDDLVTEHEKLIRAVRMEAQRWKLFYVVAMQPAELRIYALDEWWRKWSGPAFENQKCDLFEWAYAVRAKALREGVDLPYGFRCYLRSLESL